MAKNKEEQKPTREVVREHAVARYQKYIGRQIQNADDPEGVLLEMAATGAVVSDELFSRLGEIISDKNRGGLERALDIQKLLEDNEEWFGPRAQILNVLDRNT